jgi:hypothetical protein
MSLFVGIRREGRGDQCKKEFLYYSYKAAIFPSARGS